MFDRIFVTGGAEFIRSNFVLQPISQTAGKIINYDKLIYAGNLKNLASLQNDPRHVFVRGDINDAQAFGEALAKYQPEAIVPFAAESHVDRSTADPADFSSNYLISAAPCIQSVKGCFGEDHLSGGPTALRRWHFAGFSALSSSSA